MADKTMPPVSEPLTSPSVSGAPGDESAMQQPQGGDDGSVMISMPKLAFDSIHQLIVQLAQGVDQLAQSVNQQASGAGQQPAPGQEMAPAAGQEPAGDDEFLQNIASEGNQRTR